MLYGAATMGSCYMIVSMTLVGAKNNPGMKESVRHGPETPKLKTKS